MHAPLLLTSTLLLLSLKDPGRMEVTFAQRLRTADVCWVEGHAHLLVTSVHFDEPGTVAFLERGKLYDWAGAVTFNDLRGVGRDADGRLVMARVFHSHKRGAGIEFFRRLDPAASRHDNLHSIILEPREHFVSFFPSDSAKYLTNLRLGDAMDKDFGCRFILPGKFWLYAEHADLSMNCALIGWSHIWSQTSPVIPGGLVTVNVSTGEVLPDTLLGPSGDSHSEPIGDGSLWNRKKERLTGILADPRRPGEFFASVGRLHGTGRLLHRDAAGDWSIWYSNQHDSQQQIPWAPCDWAERAAKMEEEPVLAMCLAKDNGIFLLMPSGLMRTDRAGVARFCGMPKFERVGGFLIADNLREVVIVLPNSVPEDYSHEYDQFRNIQMVAKE